MNEKEEQQLLNMLSSFGILSVNRVASIIIKSATSGEARGKFFYLVDLAKLHETVEEDRNRYKEFMDRLAKSLNQIKKDGEEKDAEIKRVLEEHTASGNKLLPETEINTSTEDGHIDIDEYINQNQEPDPISEPMALK